MRRSLPRNISPHTTNPHPRCSAPPTAPHPRTTPPPPPPRAPPPAARTSPPPPPVHPHAPAQENRYGARGIIPAVVPARVPERAPERVPERQQQPAPPGPVRASAYTINGEPPRSASMTPPWGTHVN